MDTPNAPVAVSVDDTEEELRAEFKACSAGIRNIEGMDYATIAYDNFKVAIARALYRDRQRRK